MFVKRLSYRQTPQTLSRTEETQQISSKLSTGWKVADSPRQPFPFFRSGRPTKTLRGESAAHRAENLSVGREPQCRQSTVPLRAHLPPPFSRPRLSEGGTGSRGECAGPQHGGRLALQASDS